MGGLYSGFICGRTCLKKEKEFYNLDKVSLVKIEPLMFLTIIPVTKKFN
jgi:hypothetical protein